MPVTRFMIGIQAMPKTDAPIIIIESIYVIRDCYCKNYA